MNHKQTQSILPAIGNYSYHKMAYAWETRRFTIVTITHSWSWAVLEKPPIVQLLKKFPAFYGTSKVHCRVHKSHPLVPFWARSIQSIPYHPISLRSILILSTHLSLDLPRGLFPSGSPTYTLYRTIGKMIVLYILFFMFLDSRREDKRFWT
jgi:hypothetical protein